MPVAIDKKYRKELRELKTTDETSFSSYFKNNFAHTLLTIILGFLVSLVVPFLPHPKYGFGNPPNGFDGYVNAILKMNIFFILVALLLVFIVSTIAYVRTRFDNRAGFIKIGNFKVIRTSNHIDFTLIRLNNGQRLKIPKTEKDFEKIAPGDIVEVKKSASNKLLGYRILY